MATHRPYPRKLRIDAQILRELMLLLQEGFGDPRLRNVTLTSVDVAPDLRSARVLVSRMGLDTGPAVEALNGMAGRLRGELGRRLRLRRAPELRFHGDELPDAAAHLSKLIRDAVRDDQGHQAAAKRSAAASGQDPASNPAGKPVQDKPVQDE